MESYTHETIIKDISDKLLKELKEEMMDKIITVSNTEYRIIGVHVIKNENWKSNISDKNKVQRNKRDITTNIFEKWTIPYKGKKYKVLLELHLESDFKE